MNHEGTKNTKGHEEEQKQLDWNTNPAFLISHCFSSCFLRVLRAFVVHLVIDFPGSPCSNHLILL